MTQAEMSDALVRNGYPVRQTETAPARDGYPPWFRVDAVCPRCGKGALRLRRAWLPTDSPKVFIEGNATASCACGYRIPTGAA